jgi:hypothetical protein
MSFYWHQHLYDNLNSIAGYLSQATNLRTFELKALFRNIRTEEVGELWKATLKSTPFAATFYHEPHPGLPRPLWVSAGASV